MQRTLIRRLSVGALVVGIAAVAAASALAVSSNRPHFGPRAGLAQGGFPPFGPFGGPAFGRPGFFGFRVFGGPGFGFGGPGFGHRGGGLLGVDVLTPAASYLGISLSDLQSDLKGGKTLAQEATAKGKTAAGLIDAIVAAEKKVLDSQNAAGWLTDAQETAVLADLKDAIADLVNNGPPVPLVHTSLVQTAADYLGMSVSDLQSDLRNGKTLADEAAAKGKSVDGLVQALAAPAKTDLDKRVASGDITQAQETSILNRLTAHLTDLVNGKHGDKTAGALQQAIRKATVRV
jgi:hypothetical protein